MGDGDPEDFSDADWEANHAALLEITAPEHIENDSVKNENKQSMMYKTRQTLLNE